MTIRKSTSKLLYHISFRSVTSYFPSRGFSRSRILQRGEQFWSRFRDRCTISSELVELKNHHGLFCSFLLKKLKETRCLGGRANPGLQRQAREESGILSRAVHEVAFPWAIRARTQTKIGLSQRNYGTLFHPKGDVEGSDPEIVVF
jgi:hypothetical protein